MKQRNTECNRIRYTTLKIYCDQMNNNITTQFLTEHFLTLQVFFYKCSVLLPLVMQQTSRRYSNLPKKVTCTRTMALTILSRSSWRSTGLGGMCTLSFTNLQNEKSMGIRPFDLGGHGMQPPRPIHLSENVWFRYGGQAGNWVISLTWQCGGCYVWDCLYGRRNFNCFRS
jgi:hypothetical protein